MAAVDVTHRNPFPNAFRASDCAPGREAVDLVDGAIEWRARRRSPVDSLALAERLLEVDPGNSLWPRAVADSLLREALRADGRGDLAGARPLLAGAAPLLGQDGPEAGEELVKVATRLRAELGEARPISRPGR